MKIILKGLVVLGILGFTVLGMGFAQDADVTIAMDNNRANAYLVLSVSGAEGVSELNVDNPALTLEVGKRYTFDFSEVNNIYHPFDLRAADGTILLAQNLTQGSFEGDEAVAFQTDEDFFSFTLTPELAAALSSYYCSIHGSMTGSITVTGL